MTYINDSDLILINGGTPSVVVTGTPVSGDVIVATTPTTAQWQPQSGGGGGGGFTAGGDLSGSSTSQQVVSITGAAGVINVASSGNVITWAAATTAPGLAQASESSATKGADFHIKPQQSTHATDAGGGNLVLDFQTPTGAGVDAALLFTIGGTLQGGFGGYPGFDTNYAAFWGGLNGSAPTANNVACYFGSGVMITGELLVNTILTPSGDLTINSGEAGLRWGTTFTGAISGGSTSDVLALNSPVSVNTNVLQDATPSAVTTTNATPTTVYTDTAIPASSCYDYIVTVVGIEPSTLDVYRADLAATYINTAGTVSVVGAAPVALNVRGTATGLTYGGAALVISGTQIKVQVTGLSSTTIDWNCTISRLKVA